jgi:hypothetical protein
VRLHLKRWTGEHAGFVLSPEIVHFQGADGVTQLGRQQGRRRQTQASRTAFAAPAAVSSRLPEDFFNYCILPACGCLWGCWGKHLD